jgi:hypothetical protein
MSILCVSLCRSSWFSFGPSRMMIRLAAEKTEKMCCRAILKTAWQNGPLRVGSRQMAFPNSCAYPWPCYAEIRLGEPDRSLRFTQLPFLRCYLIEDFSPLGQPQYRSSESRGNEISPSPLSAGHFVSYTDDAKNILTRRGAVRSARQAHNLEVVGSNPTAATSGIYSLSSETARGTTPSVRFFVF